MTETSASRSPRAGGRPAAVPTTLRDMLLARSAPGTLFTALADHPGWVQCYACGHRCKIPPGRDGVCKVRINVDGSLRVPDGYVGGVQCDPIEKKPFFHVLPGASTLSFGMLGCDYHCSFCQNWITSQTLRDPAAIATPERMSAAEIVDLALAHQAPIITSTYNEPLITSEWAVKIMQLGKEHGLLGAYVSNGNATPEVLDFLRPYIDLYKVDLKTFQDRHYRRLGGRLQPVLDTIAGLKKRGFWVEVVTLIIPGFNDAESELRQVARFLAGIDRGLPWHVTAFHQQYRMREASDTEARHLLAAYDIGRAEGLDFVYAGNRPGMVGDRESTFCPGCGSRLIERQGYRVGANRLRDGACPDCGRAIPGVWALPEIRP